MATNNADASRENEPLLGGPGDATQGEGAALGKNLILGTAPIAQIGIWSLAAIVWGCIITKPEVMKLQLFVAHPLLNSVGILLIVQAMLIVQPTKTQEQKVQGTYAHAALSDLGLFALVGGAVCIFMNKAGHGGAHYESPHAKIGLITYILLVVQVLVGGSAFFVPKLFGSVARAKSLYKYHRASGYALLLLMFMAVSSSTQTDFNKNSIHIPIGGVIAAAVVTLVGILPRVKKSKFGL